MSHRMFPGMLLVACAASCTNRSPDTTSVPDPAPSALDSAHEAYLDGDWIALGERVRDVLLDARATDLAKENALELLDKAYEVNSGKLPSASRLRADIEKLIFGNVNEMSPDGPLRHVFVQGNMRDASHVAGVTVRRLPDETLLDRATGMGKYEIKHDIPGYEQFNLDALVPVLPADGVISIRVEFDDGSAFDCWCIARSMASTSVPEMRSPVSSASFADPNPLVRWVSFRSPQYLPFEQRVLSLWELGTERSGKEQSWGYWKSEPGDLDSVRIGDPTGTQSDPKRTRLEPGDYWVGLDFAELRTFGPVTLQRMSRSVEPFHVVR